MGACSIVSRNKVSALSKVASGDQVRDIGAGTHEAACPLRNNDLLREEADAARTRLGTVLEPRRSWPGTEVGPGMLHSRAIVGVDALSPVIDALLGRQTENPAVS